MMDAVSVIGKNELCGVYLLWIDVINEINVVFGKFRDGEPLVVPRSKYIYIGSAMGRKGAVTLGRRLLRHATRSGEKPPHDIRVRMVLQFEAIGLGGSENLPRQGKRLHWHVDYLLDEINTNLEGVIAIRTDQISENVLGNKLMDDTHTLPLVRGLGARDYGSHTHLLNVKGGDDWWTSWIERLKWEFG